MAIGPATGTAERKEKTVKPEGTGEALTEANLFLPDGEFDLRVSKLIRNTLFESQMKYEFVDGDISAFLRYKYYARNFTWKIGVFDAVEFERLGGRTEEFDRVRGGLVLFERPVDYWTRWLLLLQYDDLAFGDITNPDQDRANFYTKVALQIGSPFDSRLNAIAGESRGRTPRVLTAHKALGPQDAAFVIAVTQGWEGVNSDFNYTKIEAEGLKRWGVGSFFAILRAHGGTVPHKLIREGTNPDDPDSPLFTIPSYELFEIGGRDAMKGVDGGIRGSEEIHLTTEIFKPIFIDRDYQTRRVRWSNLYAIAYTGAGNVGFDSDIYSELGDWVLDAGLGIEATIHIGRRNFLLSMVYAQTVRAREFLEGNRFQVSLRRVR